VAEDHVKLAEAVAAGLRREGMAVDIALDGQQALDRASVTDYDVIVLDRDLPEVHGDEVCRHLVATRAGRRLDLTVKEFAVLQLLLEAQGAVVPAEQLLEKVWDEMADPFTTTVKATIHRLRAKLGDPPIIHNIPQAGYRI